MGPRGMLQSRVQASPDSEVLVHDVSFSGRRWPPRTQLSLSVPCLVLTQASFTGLVSNRSQQDSCLPLATEVQCADTQGTSGPHEEPRGQPRREGGPPAPAGHLGRCRSSYFVFLFFFLGDMRSTSNFCASLIVPYFALFKSSPTSPNHQDELAAVIVSSGQGRMNVTEIVPVGQRRCVSRLESRCRSRAGAVTAPFTAPPSGPMTPLGKYLP